MAWVKTNLEVSELRELLAALIEAAEVWLGLFMDDLVGTNVPTLSESFAADIALVRPLACMASLMSLRSKLAFRSTGEGG